MTIQRPNVCPERSIEYMNTFIGNTVQQARILHIKTPNFPQFRFEYHPIKRRCYLIRVGAAPEIGEVIAFNIENEGAAHNAVLIWLRGYRTAKGEMWDDAGKLIRKDQGK